MRVLIVSQYYPPENTYLVPSLAHKLAEQGHRVRVLTGYPNYPSGRIFDGYEQRWRTYEDDGSVKVCRVPLYADHSQSVIRRILNYLSFGLSSAAAWRFVAGADVVYVYATQLTAALGPWFWRMLGGPPYVLHIQDLWPDSILGSSLVRPGRRARMVASILSSWIANVYARSSTIIGIAPTMVSTLVERGVPKAKIELVYNWANEEFPPRERPRKAPGNRTTRVLYAGNVGDLQDLETAIIAAHRAADAGVELTILGDGVALPRLRSLCEGIGGTSVRFRDALPSREMANVYRESDYALVCLKDLSAFRGTIPSKLQGALAHGVPIISTVQGDVREMVEGLRLGFVADAESVQSLEDALRAASALREPDRTAMAERGIQAYQELFSLSAAGDSLDRILTDAAKRS